MTDEGDVSEERGTLEIGPGEEAIVVRLAGEIDIANAGAFEARILAEGGDSGALIVDLSEVTYFDSSGVHLLDHVVAAAEGAGRSVRVVVPEGNPARTVLRICAFREDLLVESLADAG